MRSAIFVIISLLVVATAFAQTTARTTSGVTAIDPTASAIPAAEPTLYTEPAPVAKPKKKAIREDYSMEAQMLQRGQGRVAGSSKLKFQPYRRELYSGLKSSLGSTPYRPSGEKSLVKKTCKLGASVNVCK